MQRHFDILGVLLTLAGPSKWIEPLAIAYRRFEVPRAGSATTGLDIRVNEREIRIDGHATPLVPSLDPQIQIHHRLQAALMDAIDSVAVLHAAALVDHEGGALLLAGPSGHGKSSLALEAATRGYGFLSDDYAPLELDTSRIRPFPRAVAVRPGSKAPIPESFRAASDAATSVRLFGKSLLDVGEHLGEDALARDPVPLRNVIVLSSDAEHNGPHEEATRVGLAVARQHADELHARFASTAGVEIVEKRDEPHWTLWRLRLDPTQRPTEALSEVFDGERVVLFEKTWCGEPDFAAAPVATPIRRREAAALLGREMLNRRKKSALLKRYGGNVAELFLDLAGALREVACWRLRVGGVRETADLIETLVGCRTESRVRPESAAS